MSKFQKVFLVKVHEGGNSFTRVFDDNKVQIGRASEAHIGLSDPSISRLHLEITIKHNRIWLMDMGSANGSFLNGQQLVAHKTSSYSPGDLIQLGKNGVEISVEPIEKAFSTKELSESKLPEDEKESLMNLVQAAHAEALRIQQLTKEQVEQMMKATEQRVNQHIAQANAKGEEIIVLAHREAGALREEASKQHSETILKAEKDAEAAVQGIFQQADRRLSESEIKSKEIEVKAQKEAAAVVAKAEQESKDLLQKARLSILEMRKEWDLEKAKLKQESEKQISQWLENAQAESQGIVEKAKVQGQEILEAAEKRKEEIVNMAQVLYSDTESEAQDKALKLRAVADTELKAAHKKSQQMIQDAKLEVEKMTKEKEDEIEKKRQEILSLAQSKAEEIISKKEELIQEEIKKIQNQAADTIQQARAQAEDLLAQAKMDAEEITKMARKNAQGLSELTKSESDKLLAEADRKAQETMSSADNKARRLMQDAESYAAQLKAKSDERKADIEKRMKDILPELHSHEERLAELKSQIQKIEKEKTNLDKKNHIAQERLEHITVQQQQTLEEQKRVDEEVKKIKLALDEALQQRKKALIETEEMQRMHAQERENLQLEIKELKEKTQKEIETYKSRESIKLDQLKTQELAFVQNLQKEMQKQLNEQRQQIAKNVSQLVQGNVLTFVKSQVKDTPAFHEKWQSFQKEITVSVEEEIFKSSTDTLKLDKPTLVTKPPIPKWVRWAGGAIALCVMLLVIPATRKEITVYLNAQGFGHAAEEFASQMHEERARRYTFEQKMEWHESYTDLVLYTKGYIEIKLESQYQDIWVRKLQDFLYGKLRIDEDSIIQVISKEAALVAKLKEQKEQIHPDRVNEEIAKMKEIEAESTLEIKTLLKTESNYKSFQSFSKDFYFENSPKPETK